MAAGSKAVKKTAARIEHKLEAGSDRVVKEEFDILAGSGIAIAEGSSVLAVEGEGGLAAEENSCC